MSLAFVEKLKRRANLPESDGERLAPLLHRRGWVESRAMVAVQGDAVDTMFVVLSGWACRYQTLPGGGRQIVGLLLPGDFTVVHPGLRYRRTDSVCALTACEIAAIPVAELEALASDRPLIGRAIQWAAVIEAAMAQERLTSLGRRSAERRLAHLLCELSERLEMYSGAESVRFQLPLTQSVLGDVLGLSPAHVNRTLQSLRSSRFVTLDTGLVVISDMGRLKTFCGFDPLYLQASIETSDFA